MLTISETLATNTKNYKISSPEGMVDFLGVNKITKDSYLSLKFSDGRFLKCSQDHPIMTIDGKVKAKHLTKHDEIQTIDGGCFLTSRRLMKKKIHLYDIVNSGSKHLCYTNGIVSHNCEFLGSLHTLILPDKIKSLAYKTPIYFNADGLRMYERPTPNHTYVLVADTARGQGKDYHAFTVIDVTQMPYVVVATFRNNIMPPMLYPNAIYAIARQYNKAYVLVEINDIGQQVADILHKDLEYDNIVHVQMQGRKGQVVNGGFGTPGSSMMGVKTSVATKRIGCAILKSLVEDSKLIVNDFGIIDEFCSFVASAESFEAEEGHNDDLVMSLVLFSWLSSQEYFKQMTGNDIRKDLYEEQIKHLEEEMTPFGFIDDGQAEIGYVDGSGTLWKTEDARNIDNMWF